MLPNSGAMKRRCGRAKPGIESLWTTPPMDCFYTTAKDIFWTLTGRHVNRSVIVATS